MHQVMLELERRPGVESPPRARLVKVMGKPAEAVAPGKILYMKAPKGVDTTLYVHRWQKRDDFFFELRAGKVVRTDWWLELE